MFDDLAFDEKCDCGGTFKFKLADVARGRTVKCSRGCDITLTDEGGGARAIQDSGRKLDQSLKSLNRTINIKF